MTKEELEKEAEKYWINQPPFTETRDRVVQTYIDSAEPREKQIQIDAEQIRALQKQNGELTDELTKAKEHIRTLMSCLIDYIVPIDKDYCYITEARQFLKEE